MSRSIDESAWVRPTIRHIVKTTACPSCGARAGMPCRNKMFDLFGGDPDGVFRRTTKRRQWYQSYVHAERRRAATSTST